MASTLVVSPSGGGGATFAAMGSGWMASGGRYLQGGPTGAEVHAFQMVSTPSVNNQIVKRGGFRERELGPFRVYYIAASSDAVQALWEADQAAFAGDTSSITYRGQSLQNCEFDGERSKPEDGYPKYNGAGHATYRLKAMLYFKQIRK